MTHDSDTLNAAHGSDAWDTDQGESPHMVRKESRKPVFIRSPFPELFFAAVTVCTFIRFGFTVEGVRNEIFFCCLYCLSLVDAECFLIPDRCVILSVLAWAATAPFVYSGRTEILIHLMSGLGLGGIFFGTGRILKTFTGRDALGGGDVKLLAAAGLYTGSVGALFTAMLACAGGLILSLLILRRGWREYFPFGPVIAAATALILFSGNTLTAWYLGLLGLYPV